MSYLQYDGVKVLGLAAAVPKHIYHNLTDNDYFSPEDAKAIVDKTGIRERRIASPEICASDLCLAAAERLLGDMHLDREEIDALIVVTQTPDYKVPGTSNILQNKLGLKKSCAAYDINLGCSGFIIGLSMAFGLARQAQVNKVLLLDGETRSKAYSFKDRKTGFLFGDGAAACLIGKDPVASRSHFIMESDGSKREYIIIKAGSCRTPSTLENIEEKLHSDGSMRSEIQGVMDGSGVFEFVISEVPLQVKKLLQVAEASLDQVDYVVLHQANAYMNNHLTHKMKIPPEKAISSLEIFGNTSSVSIPLTIVSQLQDKLQGGKTLLLSGFGVGMSVASALVSLEAGTYLSPLVEI